MSSPTIALARAPRTPASEPLRRFLQVARGAGLRVSAAEGIDAARAFDLVGYADRELLKDTLGFVLAKTLDEKLVYEQAFDLFFQNETMRGKESEADERPPRSQAAGAGTPNAEGDTQSGSSLASLLEGEDRAALAQAIESAAREVELDKIRLLTQKNLFARRMLERMGVRELEDTLAQLRGERGDAAKQRADALDGKLESLRQTLRDRVERALLLHARGENERFREQLLKTSRLANIDPSQHDRMRVLVRKLARRIATRYAVRRRRQQRGQLDVSRTLRRNMGWGGVPFITAWKQQRIEKPRLMVLCDVSGSVAWVAEFLLMFIYSVAEVLSDVRSFAYSSSLIEVSDMLEGKPIDAAVAEVMAAAGMGSSNYGNCFANFEDGWMEHVTPKTTIVILGDARGNNNDPRTDILDRIAQRAKRVIWLNPEPRPAWGTGDSDMYRYVPYCSAVQVCATLADMERMITRLLDQG